MMRAAALTLLVLLVAGCATRPPLGAVPVDRQVLVVLHDAGAAPLLPAGSKRGYRGDLTWSGSLHARRRADALLRDHGLRELHAWRVDDLALLCLVLEVPIGVDRATLVRRLDGDRRVAHAQPVHEYRGLISGAYDDPLFEVQYGEHRQQVEAVHALTRGEGVRIAIVDGPVDAAHEDLRGQIARQVPAEDDPKPPVLRHGTAVAGVIAAAAGNGTGLVGMAPAASVTVYAACGRAQGGINRCTTVSLAEAIEQAIADDAQVINLSLAGPRDWLLERLLRHAHERGAVLVAADARDHPDRRFPASLPFVHGVGEGSPSWFAREAQFSTRAGGGYQLFFGSSMSAAGAAGMAALLRALRPADEAGALLDDLLRDGCLSATAAADLEPISGRARCR
ncbi:MAG TPA: S8 family serine peptidase [Pseudomonadales bacterium]